MHVLSQAKAARTVLDLGCGQGRDLSFWGVARCDQVTGIDSNPNSLEVARIRYPARVFLEARGERLPFPSESFERVVSGVALPYMHIPRTVGEIHRVLVPGGCFQATLHSPGFTWRELRQNAWPHPKATLFRLFVLSNGIVFHLSGCVLEIGEKAESCQTERGMRLALADAGFSGIAFRRLDDGKLLVEARKR